MKYFVHGLLVQLVQSLVFVDNFTLFICILFSIVLVIFVIFHDL